MPVPTGSRQQDRALAEIAKSKGCDDPPTEVLIQCLAEHPELATCADQDGYTLLHHAVRITESIEVLNLFANSTSLMAQNKWKRTALHQACGFGRPARVVLFLVDRSAQALELPDEYGLVPLHYACWRGMDEGVIARMVEERPGAVRATSADGETPLFSACECESRLSTNVYSRLLLEWPVAATIVHTTDDGRRCTPLKRAMQLRGCDQTVIQLLLTHSVHVLIGLAQSVFHESSSASSTAKQFLRNTLLNFHPSLGHVLNDVYAPARHTSVFVLAWGIRSAFLRHGASPSTAISSALLMPLLGAIFHDPKIQAMVKDSQYQAMICCLSKTSVTAPSLLDRCAFVSCMLESAGENLSCLYVCLREFPDLLFGSTRKVKKATDNRTTCTSS